MSSTRSLQRSASQVSGLHAEGPSPERWGGFLAVQPRPPDRTCDEGTQTLMFGMKDDFAASMAPLTESEPRDPPPPWTPFVRRDESLLTHIGFSADCRYCQIVSNAGTSVLSVPSLECVANSSEDCDADVDLRDLTIAGHGPLRGRRISTVGIDGGGLARRTSDGWMCREMHVRVSFQCAFLIDPDWSKSALTADPFSSQTKVFEGKELIAFGFCACGNHLVAANSYILQVSSRSNARKRKRIHS